HKCIEIGKRQRTLGARGITVSTFAEARAFADAGFDDITWALPNPLSHLAAILELQHKTTLRILVDDLDAAHHIEEACRASRTKLHVWLKIDCGYHRAGVDPKSQRALELIRALSSSQNLVFDGILTHAGHGYHAASKAELRQIAAQERD